MNAKGSGESITYVIKALNKGGEWDNLGLTFDMSVAKRNAQKALEEKKKGYREVRIDKHFRDPSQNRQVTTTIFQLSRAQKTRSFITLWLLLLAASAGVASFILAYFLGK